VRTPDERRTVRRRRLGSRRLNRRHDRSQLDGYVRTRMQSYISISVSTCRDSRSTGWRWRLARTPMLNPSRSDHDLDST
jgi:hypothetical protein